MFEETCGWEVGCRAILKNMSVLRNPTGWKNRCGQFFLTRQTKKVMQNIFLLFLKNRVLEFSCDRYFP